MRSLRTSAVCLLALILVGAAWAQPEPQPDFMQSGATPGNPGGKLVVSIRSEPRTFNPVTAVDQVSVGIISRIMADLIHINRGSQKTEPALARSWAVSKDGTVFTVKLRRGLKFSDGVPFDADDVIFSFKVYLDEKVHSPHRDLLMVGDKPIKVEKLDRFTVRFVFPSPYAPLERFFDTVPMLPRHLLEEDYLQGNIAQAWSLNTAPDKIAGLGPFRLKQFVPGERVVLERNPYYWKVDSKGQKLPYMDEMTFLIVPNQDAQVVRFQAGDTQIISGLSGDNFAALEPEQQSRHFRLYDAGPGLEYNFLMFNLNDDTGKYAEVARRQKWFRDVRFRQAISAAIDRAAIVRLVYHGRATPLATHVSPGNKLWFNHAIPAPVHSPEKAKQLLRAGGFSWNSKGELMDSSGQPVEFTILVSSSNQQRMQMAPLILEDLKAIGITAHIVSMEARAFVDRVLSSHEYDSVIMGLASGDVDPTPDNNVWMSNGQTHLWHLGEKTPATPWEAELDHLLQKQVVTLNYAERKKLYDRFQQVEAEQLPMIYLITPSVLVGAQENLRNFQPAVIEQYTFWNAEELFWLTPAGKH
ncbi:MAG TPA: ABC transporter substrate-binding protein [Candidatus Angelobacter sp.]|nr:ABC transporter substrate-binding protein [Candidatus Angelobacter sp.]